MILNLLNAGDYAEYLAENRISETRAALLTQTVGMTRETHVRHVLTAQVYDEPASFIVRLEVHLGHYPEVFHDQEGPKLKERAVALERELEALGIKILPGYWTVGDSALR